MVLAHAFAILVLLGAPAPASQTLLQDLGTAYAADASVPFGGVTLGAASTVTAATLANDKARVVGALRVGYAPEGKSSFETYLWSEIQDILSVKIGSASKPDEGASAKVVVGARLVPTTWTIGGKTIQGVAVFDRQGRLAFETLIFLPTIRVPLFDVPHL